MLFGHCIQFEINQDHITLKESNQNTNNNNHQRTLRLLRRYFWFVYILYIMCLCVTLYIVFIIYNPEAAKKKLFFAYYIEEHPLRNREYFMERYVLNLRLMEFGIEYENKSVLLSFLFFCCCWYFDVSLIYHHHSLSSSTPRRRAVPLPH